MSTYTPIYTADDSAPFYFTGEAFQASSHGAAHSLGLRSKLRECVTLGVYYTHLTLKLADPQHLPGSPSELRGHRTQRLTPLALETLKASGLVSAFVTRAAAAGAARPERPQLRAIAGRIPAVEIELELAAGAFAAARPVLSFKRFSPEDDLWRRANDALLRWEGTAPDDGSYLRVEYTIRYADGRALQSCYLLTRRAPDSAEPPPDLGHEVRRGAEMFAARRRPDHLTEEGYRDLLRAFGRGSRESSARLLDFYEISEGRPAAPDVPAALLHAGLHQTQPPLPA